MSKAGPHDLRGTTAVLLAGGLGTRLRPAVPKLPKVLAEVNGRPFLSYLLDQVASAGIRRAVICAGYKSERIVSQFGGARGPLALGYSVETRLLGTGGALRLALPWVSSDPVLVMNGDSYFSADLNRFLAQHRESRASDSILLARCDDTARFGAVQTDDSGALIRFDEKGGRGGPGWINAGIYLLSHELIRAIPAGEVVSLEREVFPCHVGRGLFGFGDPGEFIDIGTPESYRQAGAFIRNRLDGERTARRGDRALSEETV
jgi:NDP-sugar pyrophosphorylase family protein